MLVLFAGVHWSEVLIWARWLHAAFFFISSAQAFALLCLAVGWGLEKIVRVAKQQTRVPLSGSLGC